MFSPLESKLNVEELLLYTTYLEQTTRKLRSAQTMRTVTSLFLSLLNVLFSSFSHFCCFSLYLLTSSYLFFNCTLMCNVWLHAPVNPLCLNCAIHNNLALLDLTPFSEIHVRVVGSSLGCCWDPSNRRLEVPGPHVGNHTNTHTRAHARTHIVDVAPFIWVSSDWEADGALAVKLTKSASAVLRVKAPGLFSAPGSLLFFFFFSLSSSPFIFLQRVCVCVSVTESVLVFCSCEYAGK